MNFDKESKSEKKRLFFFGGGEGVGTDTKTVCQTVSVEVKYKNATINTMQSKWYNQHFEICKLLLKHKPYNSNFELSSK